MHLVNRHTYSSCIDTLPQATTEHTMCAHYRRRYILCAASNDTVDTSDTFDTIETIDTIDNIDSTTSVVPLQPP